MSYHTHVTIFVFSTKEYSFKLAYYIAMPSGLCINSLKTAQALLSLTIIFRYLNSAVD